MKYKSLRDVNLENEKLSCNIAVAISEHYHLKLTELREFFRAHNINIAENLRQCIYSELDNLCKIKEEKIRGNSLE